MVPSSIIKKHLYGNGNSPLRNSSTQKISSRNTKSRELININKNIISICTRQQLESDLYAENERINCIEDELLLQQRGHSPLRNNHSRQNVQL